MSSLLVIKMFVLRKIVLKNGLYVLDLVFIIPGPVLQIINVDRLILMTKLSKSP